MNTVSLNINISFNQIVDVVKKLSPKEKQLLNEVIWDENMPIPIEHQLLVLDRITKSKKTPERMLDWDLTESNLK